MNRQEHEHLTDLVAKALAILNEHFDSAIILASSYDGDVQDSSVFRDSFGCPYSLYGQMKEQVALHEEGFLETAFMISGVVLEEDDDDPDDNEEEALAE